MTSLAVRLVRSSTNSSKTRHKLLIRRRHERSVEESSEQLAFSVKGVPVLTVSGGGEAQVPHAVADQLRQLFPLRASVEVVALLSDALGVVLAGVPVHSLPPHAFLTQTPRPLHALLPQQGVICLVVTARLVAPVLGVLAVVSTD